MPPPSALAPWLFAASALVSEPSPPRGARAVLERVVAHYAGAGGLEVSTAVRRVLGPRSVTNRGRAVFGEPGQMRWEFERPKGYVRVSDGATIWLYDPGTRGYACAKVPPDGGRSPFFLFTGARRVLRAYSAQFVPDAPGGGLVLRLTAKRRGDSATVTLRLDPHTYAVRQMHWEAPSSDVWLDIAERRAGFHPGADVFRFDPPPGVPARRPPGYNGPC